MQDFLKERTAQMTKEELCHAFEEYAELNRTGILKDGIARIIEREYATTYQIKSVVLETVRMGIMYEMALRFYKQQ